jgi:hypothetical protein
MLLKSAHLEVFRSPGGTCFSEAAWRSTQAYIALHFSDWSQIECTAVYKLLFLF